MGVRLRHAPSTSTRRARTRAASRVGAVVDRRRVRASSEIAFPDLDGMTGGGDDTAAPLRRRLRLDGSLDRGRRTDRRRAQPGRAHQLQPASPSSTTPARRRAAASPTPAATTPTAPSTIATDNGTDAGAGRRRRSAVLERQTRRPRRRRLRLLGRVDDRHQPRTRFADGACARYRLRVSDHVGNQATFTVRHHRARRHGPAPTVTVDDPGAYLRAEVALGASASDAVVGHRLGRAPALARRRRHVDGDRLRHVRRPTATSLDTVPLADGLYDLRARVTDNGGNVTDVRRRRRPARRQHRAERDDGRPRRQPPRDGHPRLVRRATRAPASPRAPTSSEPRAAAAWTATPAAWDTTALARRPLRRPRDRHRQRRELGHLCAGRGRLVDNTAPTVTMDDPGADLSATVALDARPRTTAARGSRASSSSTSPRAGSTWTATPAAWNTIPIGDGLYDLRAIATDGAGNSTTSAAGHRPPRRQRRSERRAHRARPVRERGRGRSVRRHRNEPRHGSGRRSSSSAARHAERRLRERHLDLARHRTPPPRSRPTGRSTPTATARSAPSSATSPGTRHAAVADTLDRPHRAHRRVDHLRDRLRRRRDARRSRPTNGTDGGSGVDAGSATLERHDRSPRGRRVRLLERLERGHEPRHGRHRALRRATGSASPTRPATRPTFTSADVVQVDTHPAGRADARLLGARRQRRHGSTLHYRPGGGSFTLTAAASDPESGVSRLRLPGARRGLVRHAARAPRATTRSSARPPSPAPARPSRPRTPPASPPAPTSPSPPTRRRPPAPPSTTSTATARPPRSRSCSPREATPAAVSIPRRPSCAGPRPRSSTASARRSAPRPRSPPLRGRRTPTSPSRAATATATSWSSATRSATRPSCPSPAVAKVDVEAPTGSLERPGRQPARHGRARPPRPPTPAAQASRPSSSGARRPAAAPGRRSAPTRARPTRPPSTRPRPPTGSTTSRCSSRTAPARRPPRRS